MDPINSILINRDDVAGSMLVVWKDLCEKNYHFDRALHELASDLQNISLGEMAFSDYYLAKKQQDFPAGTLSTDAAVLNEMIELIDVGLGLSLPTFSHSPARAYSQSMFSLLQTCVMSGLAQLKTDTNSEGGVKIRGEMKGGFKREGEQILFSSTFTCKEIEFKDGDSIASKVPFQAKVSYTAKFIPGTSPNELGYFELQFPIRISGDDAGIYADLMLKPGLSVANLATIKDRKANGAGCQSSADEKQAKSQPAINSIQKQPSSTVKHKLVASIKDTTALKRYGFKTRLQKEGAISKSTSHASNASLRRPKTNASSTWTERAISAFISWISRICTSRKTMLITSQPLKPLRDKPRARSDNRHQTASRQINTVPTLHKPKAAMPEPCNELSKLAPTTSMPFAEHCRQARADSSDTYSSKNASRSSRADSDLIFEMEL